MEKKGDTVVPNAVSDRAGRTVFSRANLKCAAFTKESRQLRLERLHLQDLDAGGEYLSGIVVIFQHCHLEYERQGALVQSHADAYEIRRLHTTKRFHLRRSFHADQHFRRNLECPALGTINRPDLSDLLGSFR